MQFTTLALPTLFLGALAAPAAIVESPTSALDNVDLSVVDETVSEVENTLPLKRGIADNADVDALNEVDAVVADLPTDSLLSTGELIDIKRGVLDNPDVDALNTVEATVADLPTGELLNLKRGVLDNANVDALNEVEATVADLPTGDLLNLKRGILDNADVDALNSVEATVADLPTDELLNLKRGILDNANVNALNEVEAAVAQGDVLDVKRGILDNPDVDVLNEVDAAVADLPTGSLLGEKRQSIPVQIDLLGGLLEELTSPLAQIHDVLASVYNGEIITEVESGVSELTNLLGEVLGSLESVTGGLNVAKRDVSSTVSSVDLSSATSLVSQILELLNGVESEIKSTVQIDAVSKLLDRIDAQVSNLLNSLDDLDVDSIVEGLNLDSLNLGGLL